MAKAAVNFIDIKPLVRDVNELKQEMHQVHNKVDTISDDLSVAKDDLAQLNRQFQEFMKDRIRAGRRFRRPPRSSFVFARKSRKNLVSTGRSAKPCSVFFRQPI